MENLGDYQLFMYNSAARGQSVIQPYRAWPLLNILLRLHLHRSSVSAKRASPLGDDEMPTTGG